ncbi:MAG: hypothetical protein U0795_23230 [Pirellulales bacterium]
MRSLMWVHLLILFAPALAVAGNASPSPLYARQSDSFRVISNSAEHASSYVLERCEQLKETLQRVWLGDSSPASWRPRCQIVVHTERAGYLRAVGPQGQQTLGSSWIEFDSGRPAVRRIDLLADNQGNLSALAHELTHVVLADRFQGRQPPRWLDEGVATMADSSDKRLLHRRDCRYALETGSALRLVEVLHLESFHSAEEVPPFYGQSLALVDFLASKGAPGTIVDFAESAMNHGYDHALRLHYDIPSVAALEQLWRKHAHSGAPATLFASLNTKISP